MRNTARPRRKCGRPWRSRRTLTICSAIRMGVKIRPRSDSPGPQTTRDFWAKCPEVRRVWGGSPTSIFAGPRPCENGKCVHTCLACRFVQPPKMARKNGGTRFSYASSVSRAFCSPSAVYFITVSSFSSIELSMTSICFRQVLSPLSLSGKKN